MGGNFRWRNGATPCRLSTVAYEREIERYFPQKRESERAREEKAKIAGSAGMGDGEEE